MRPSPWPTQRADAYSHWRVRACVKISKWSSPQHTTTMLRSPQNSSWTNYTIPDVIILPYGVKIFTGSYMDAQIRVEMFVQPIALLAAEMANENSRVWSSRRPNKIFAPERKLGRKHALQLYIFSFSEREKVPFVFSTAVFAWGAVPPDQKT